MEKIYKVKNMALYTTDNANLTLPSNCFPGK